VRSRMDLNRHQFVSSCDGATAVVLEAAGRPTEHSDSGAFTRDWRSESPLIVERGPRTESAEDPNDLGRTPECVAGRAWPADGQLQA
jgi:hypothetical protein